MDETAGIILPIIILTFLSSFFLIIGIALRAVGKRTEMNPYGNSRDRHKQLMAKHMNPQTVRQGAETVGVVGRIFVMVAIGLGIVAWAVYYFGLRELV